MTVHREQNMKREDQQDATIRCLLLTSVSTCFGHHYAHLQENKGPVTVFVAFCWSSLFTYCTKIGTGIASSADSRRRTGRSRISWSIPGRARDSSVFQSV